MGKLKTEIEKLDVQYKESLSQQQVRFGVEIENFRDMLQDTELARDNYKQEVNGGHFLSEKIGLKINVI